jgi:hypothetical protein
VVIGTGWSTAIAFASGSGLNDPIATA